MIKRNQTQVQTQTQVQPIVVSFMLLRARTGLSQEDLAAALTKEFKTLGSHRKVTKKTVSDWECGRHKPRLSPDETLVVCNTLRCSLHELAYASQLAIANSTVYHQAN